MKRGKFYGGRYTYREEKKRLFLAGLIAIIISLTIIKVANAIIELPTVNPYTDIIIEEMVVDTITVAEPIPEPKLPTEKEIIELVAKKNGVVYTDYLLRLAYCESRHQMRAKNCHGNTPASCDRGLFQINSYWQKQVTDEQAYDPYFATQFTIDKINAGYQSLWTCDKIVKGKTKEQLGYNY